MNLGAKGCNYKESTHLIPSDPHVSWEIYAGEPDPRQALITISMVTNAKSIIRPITFFVSSKFEYTTIYLIFKLDTSEVSET